MPIGAKMYESAKTNSSSTEPKAEDNSTKPEDGPIEGEVVDDKDKKEE